MESTENIVQRFKLAFVEFIGVFKFEINRTFHDWFKFT